jgi:chondroitin sulfate proteoglycan 4
VTIFDQAMIDSGRLHYVQAASNATNDHVIFDVTNGIWSTRGLWLKIVVVPKHVYVEGGELTVTEGGMVPLSRAHVAILTEYYAARVNEFKVTKGPKAGKLLLVKEGGKMAPISRFTTRQLEAGQIQVQNLSHRVFSLNEQKHYLHNKSLFKQYQHNGSEALTDQFTIIARVSTGERDSLPATVRVNVLPVDDEKPILVNNTGLKLYEGAVIVIKPEQLGKTHILFYERW